MNFLNFNQTYKYSITAKDYRYSLIETSFNPTFVDSYINNRGLLNFLNTNINTFNCNNSFVTTQNYPVFCYVCSV